MRREAAQTAVPGGPYADARSAAEHQPESKWNWQQANAGQRYDESRNASAIDLRIPEHQAIREGEIGAEAVAGQLRCQGIKQLQEQGREQAQEYACQREQAHAGEHCRRGFMSMSGLLAPRLRQERDAEGFDKAGCGQSAGKGQRGTAERKHDSHQVLGCPEALQQGLVSEPLAYKTVKWR